MNVKIEKLHTAIRRYCINRHHYWTENYQKLNAAEKGFSFENGYSNEALATFPRYNVLNAILTEIERHRPTDFSSYEEAKEFFILAIKEAQDIFTKPSNGEIQNRVMNEERELLCKHISQLRDEDLSIIEPLYYRRVLSQAESNEISAKLKTIWNVDGYWYPLTTWKIDNAEALRRFQHIPISIRRAKNGKIGFCVAVKITAHRFIAGCAEMHNIYLII